MKGKCDLVFYSNIIIIRYELTFIFLFFFWGVFVFSIIASAPFRFLVGSNKRVFTVHAGLISHHSKSLGDLINGGMSEANQGCASLEDVEESTFVRFSQYGYTGDYIAADPEILLDSSTIACTSTDTPSKPTRSTDNARPAEAIEEPTYTGFTYAPIEVEAVQSLEPNEPDFADLWTASVRKKKKAKQQPAELPRQGYPFGSFGYDDNHPTEESASSSRKEKLWKRFERRTYTVSTPSFHPRKNRESCEDYTEVFLCHARLYVFADKWGIVPLKQLSLYKLHQTLSDFTLYKERIGDIVALMQYSYDNTPHLSSINDPLRSLVIHYATCVVEDLVQSSEFKALLEEARQLASDLILKMINRLD